MRVHRRTYAVVGLLGVSVLGLVLEARDPAWIQLDPLLQPFGQGLPPGSVGAAARKDSQRTPVPVVLGRATIEELVALPGIGPTTAARIVAWRDTVGVVDALERLREVRGIGPAKLEALTPWVLLEAPQDTTARSMADSMR